MKQLQEKHLLSNNSGEYLDTKQVNQEKSYYLRTIPFVNGIRYVYQYVTMNDGTVYELSSKTFSTKGVIAKNCRGKDLLLREFKRWAINAINY